MRTNGKEEMVYRIMAEWMMQHPEVRNSWGLYEIKEYELGCFIWLLHRVTRVYYDIFLQKYVNPW